MQVKLNTVVFSALIVISTILLAVAAVKQHHAIDPEKCNNCAACSQVCPEEAISPGKHGDKDVYIIDIEKCTNCAACAQVCPEEAISEISTDLSTLPEKPAKKKK